MILGHVFWIKREPFSAEPRKVGIRHLLIPEKSHIRLRFFRLLWFFLRILIPHLVHLFCTYNIYSYSINIKERTRLGC